MKNFVLLFILIGILFVNACTTDKTYVPSTKIEPTDVKPDTTSLPVPAPGFEGVPEMIVRDDLEADTSTDDGGDDSSIDIAPTSDDEVQEEILEEIVPLKENIEEVYAFKEGYKTYDIKDWNVGIEVDPSWEVLEVVDTNYYPGITLYRGWTDTWRNQLRLGLIHNVGQSINLKYIDEVAHYYENYLRKWCTDTQENPVWEVSPTEEGWTTCLEMGDFTFEEITVDGRQAYLVVYDWKDEFRLPNGEKTKDVYSGWTFWTNLIPYGNDLILAEGGTINENVNKQKDTILYSINSVKILNGGQPIFENTEPVRENMV